MTTSPNLALAYLIASQAQKEVTHNEALNDLDALAQASVIDRTLNTPPASPSEGATYIVGGSPTGAWSGQAENLAAYYSGWRFKAPKTGWTVWSQSENRFLYYTGSGWAALAVPFLEASVTWNPGTINNGSGLTSSAITVTGVAFGDFAQVAAPYDLQGLMATAYVSAANTVAVRLQNLTGSNVTLGSGTWKVRVARG